MVVVVVIVVVAAAAVVVVSCSSSVVADISRVVHMIATANTIAVVHEIEFIDDG